MGRFVGGIGAMASLYLLVAGCSGDLFGSPSPAAAQPIIVTNNVPSGSESGMTVLLVVLGCATFILLAWGIVSGMQWMAERKRRAAAEGVVQAVTGRTVTQLGLEMAQQVSTERLQAFAAQITPDDRRQIR